VRVIVAVADVGTFDRGVRDICRRANELGVRLRYPDAAAAVAAMALAQ
jgi:hypothetical protein